MEAGGAEDAEWASELPSAFESPRDRLHRLAAEATCASGRHRPYRTVVWGRRVTKCLDCQTRLPDDYEA